MGIFDGIVDGIASLGSSAASAFGDIGSEVVNSFPDWAPVMADYLAPELSLPMELLGAGKTAMGLLDSFGGAVGSIGKAVSPFSPLLSGYMGYQGQQSTNEANLASVQKQMDFQREMWGVNASSNAYQASVARDFDAAQADKARDWMERLSGSAHQREVADLTRAGLNPMLSVFRSGAATPASASPSSPYGSTAAPTGAAARLENAAAAGINSAAAAASVRATLASASKMESESALNYATIPKVEQEVRTSASSASHLDALAKDVLWRLEWLGPAQHNLLGSEAALNDLRSKLVNQERLTDRDRQLLLQVERRLDEYKVPEAREIARSWSGGGVYNTMRPYIGDVAKLGSAASSAAGAFVGARTGLGIPREVVHRRGGFVP